MAVNSTSSIDWRQRFREVLRLSWFTRGLPEHASVEVRIRWPLYFLPLVLINQLLTPHPVWVVLFVVLVGLYGVGIYWVRQHAAHVMLSHSRLGTQLIVGDSFEDEFEVRNNHFVPVLWAELIDYSRFPGKKLGQVVACGGNTSYRWRRTVECRQRGVYRLGPYALFLNDPFGIFSLRLTFPKEEVIVIYPRIVQLAPGKFPHGQSTGVDRRRRSILGSTPAYSVLEYQPGDSLRRIHWRVTAHRGRLMVRELETEPTGDIWIVLDLYAGAQTGTGPYGTLEFGIVVAASLAAALLEGGDGRAVGLVAHGGVSEDNIPSEWQTETLTRQPVLDEEAVAVRPKNGPAQLWQILTALAPVQPGPVPLGQLLAGSRELFGPRSTLIVVTPQVEWNDVALETNGNVASEHELGGEYWPADLLHLRSGGLDANTVLLTPHPDAVTDGQVTESLVSDGQGTVEHLRAQARRVQELLLAQRVQTSLLEASDAYPPVLTHQRRRTVVRSTPSGGVVTYEVDEAVG